MSIAEIERFAADLQSNEALRAEAEKAQTSVVAFAESKGYAFTTDEVKEHVKARAKAAGKELTNAELDGVAGGLGDPELIARNEADYQREYRENQQKAQYKSEILKNLVDGYEQLKAQSGPR